MMEIPMLIKRCLTYQIRIYPHQLSGVINQYERKTIPDDILSKLTKEMLQKYVDGLYLSSCESAGDWTRGHEILKSIGFIEKTRKDGFRKFISLVYEQPETVKDKA